MTEIINYFNESSIIVKIICGLLLFLIYSMFSGFLNKFHNYKIGRPTILSWVPIINVYLLGKLVVNVVIGLLLVVLLIFGVMLVVNIPGLEAIHSLAKESYVLPYVICYLLMILLLVVIGKSKLNKIIREGTGRDALSAFISKDFDDKEPEITVTTPNVVEETIHDNYEYNKTSLSELSKLNSHTDDSNNINGGNNE